MAIGWLSILKAVPWTDVVNNAPKVADGAKKLWETVARKKSPTDATSGTSATTTPDIPTLASLETRVVGLGDEVGRLQQEMLASSQLLKALAEQNTQLIHRVDGQNRMLLAVGLIAVASLTLMLLR